MKTAFNIFVSLFLVPGMIGAGTVIGILIGSALGLEGSALIVLPAVALATGGYFLAAFLLSFFDPPS